MVSESSSAEASDWLEPLEALNTPTHSFVVVIRILPSSGANRVEAWRGSVEYVLSHERIYFRDLARLTEFVALRSGISAPPPAGLRGMIERLRKFIFFQFFRDHKSSRAARVSAQAQESISL